MKETKEAWRYAGDKHELPDLHNWKSNFYGGKEISQAMTCTLFHLEVKSDVISFTGSYFMLFNAEQGIKICIMILFNNTFEFNLLWSLLKLYA